MKFTLHKFVRRVHKDITGDIITQGKYTKLLCFLLGYRSFKKHRKFRSGLDFGPVNRFSVRKRLKDGAKLLLRRRRLCVFYGNLSLKNLKNYTEKAHYKIGNTNNNLVGLLESRLEVLVYRLHFANSIVQARQQIKSGFYLINKNIIRNCNYIVSSGDIVEVLESYKLYIANVLGYSVFGGWLWRGLPKNLEVDYRLLAACFLDMPILKNIAYPFFNTVKTDLSDFKRIRTNIVSERDERFFHERRNTRNYWHRKFARRKKYIWWFKYKRQRLLPVTSFLSRKF